MIEIVLFALWHAMWIGVGFTGGYSLSRAHHKDVVHRLRSEVALYKASADSWRARYLGGGSRD